MQFPPEIPRGGEQQLGALLPNGDPLDPCLGKGCADGARFAGGEELMKSPCSIGQWVCSLCLVRGTPEDNRCFVLSRVRASGWGLG